jgi:peptidoglycan/xylan/chitin deacetylase (PgdA/CDA1 family)
MPSSLPILTFHALDDRSSVISFPPAVFRHGIARLHESGYKTLRLAEAVNYLQRGKPFPGRSLVITFDDGYQSVFDEAFPVLQQYNMTATVFLTVGKKSISGLNGRLPSLEGRHMLCREEIMEMYHYGIDFGAHTLTHPDLTRLPFDHAQSEILDSKAIIEDTLSAPISCFAYPFGRYDERILEIVKKHFACACSDRLGLASSGSNLYALERIEAYYLRSERLFDIMLTGLFPWYIGARRFFRQIRRTISAR